MGEFAILSELHKTLMIELNYVAIAAIALYGMAHSIDFKHYVSNGRAWVWALELIGLLLLLAASVLITVDINYPDGRPIFSGGSLTLIFQLEVLAVVLFAIAGLLAALRSRKLACG